MKIADLKAIDVIQMPQFEKYIEALIKDLFLTRTKIMNEHPRIQFKRRYLVLKLLQYFMPKYLMRL